DSEWQREREARYEVDGRVGALDGEVVEEVGDDLADAGLEALDPPQRERRRDQATQPGVIGRIDGEHVPGERPPREALGEHLAARERRLHVFGQPRVVEQQLRLVVADDEPRRVAVSEGDRVHRSLLAHLREQGERVVPVEAAPGLQCLTGAHRPQFAHWTRVYDGRVSKRSRVWARYPRRSASG